MTTNPTPDPCPNCQHPQHLPGVECDAAVDHGPNRWHRCLCLARPGAALPCPPQMTCQGGTLGYADIWYLQQGHTLAGADGEISPEVLKTGPVSVGFPSAAAAPAAAPVAVPPTGQTADVFTAADLVAALRSAGEERDKVHEKDTARLRAVVARVAQMADAWEQQLPEVIRTPAVVSAIRAALEAAEAPAPGVGGDLIEDYLRFLRGQGPEPDLSGLPEEQRATVAGQFEIVTALADRDPELPPLDRDPVARRLGLHGPAAEAPAPETQTALKRAHVALAEQAGRDQAAIERVLHWATTLDAIAVEVHGPGTRHPVADHIRELLDTTVDAPAAASAGVQPDTEA